MLCRHGTEICSISNTTTTTQQRKASNMVNALQPAPKHTKQQIIDTLTEKLATSAITINVCVSGAWDVLELLKQPTLPKEPSDEILRIISTTPASASRIYEAIHNYLTTPPKPKTKKIKVWRVEWVYSNKIPQCSSFIEEVAARNMVSTLIQADYSCINIIEGEQEVPA